jgi:YbbR domain-containing protein
MTLNIPRRVQYVFIAVLLAILSWYLVSGRERVEVWIEIPVEIKSRPPELIVVDGLITKVEVRVKGPRNIIRGLDTRTLAYQLDLSGLGRGDNVIVLDPGNLPIRGQVQVLEFMPGQLIIEADRVEARTVEVEPVWEGELADDWQFVSARPDPERVQVRGAASVLDGLRMVETESIVVDGSRPEDQTRTVGLVAPQGVEVKPSAVEVALDFSPETVKIRHRVPVVFPDDPRYTFKANPPTVLLYMHAPAYRANTEDFVEEIRVVPDLEPPLEPGSWMVGYDPKLPENSRLIEKAPEKITVTIESRTTQQEQ